MKQKFVTAALLLILVALGLLVLIQGGHDACHSGQNTQIGAAMPVGGC